jgi:hypothetical protein
MIIIKWEAVQHANFVHQCPDYALKDAILVYQLAIISHSPNITKRYIVCVQYLTLTGCTPRKINIM